MNGEIQNDIALIRLCGLGKKGKMLTLPSLRTCESNEISTANRYTIVGLGQITPNSARHKAKYPEFLQVAEQQEYNEANSCGSMGLFDESF